MNAAALAKSVAGGRLAFGVGMMVAPSAVMSGWIGKAESRRPAMDLVTRAFGAREVLLGFLGLHVADRRGVGKRTIGAMALLDLTDLTATIAHRDSLPRTALPVMVAVAGSAVVAQVLAARELP